MHSSLSHTNTNFFIFYSPKPLNPILHQNPTCIFVSHMQFLYFLDNPFIELLFSSLGFDFFKVVWKKVCLILLTQNNPKRVSWENPSLRYGKFLSPLCCVFFSFRFVGILFWGCLYIYIYIDVWFCYSQEAGKKQFWTWQSLWTKVSKSSSLVVDKVIVT